MKGHLEIQSLSKAFEQEGEKVLAVKEISLHIEAGELVSFLGPSGCGKTTLLRMIAGFEHPSSGEILLDGESLTSLEAHKRNSAMVFQSYALFPHMSVQENIEYGLKIKKISLSDRKKRLQEVAELVGLQDLLQRPSAALSGGQQQRVALARALVVQPRLLLFDEPLSNLDAQLRNSMRSEIRRIQKELQITAVYVTHDQSEAMAVSDRVLIMKAGEIQQIDTPLRVYQQPKNRFVASFVGEANFLKFSRVHADEIKVLDQNWKLPTPFLDSVPHAEVLMIRPERFSLEGGDFRLEMKLQEKTFFGAYWQLQLEAMGESLRVHCSSHRAADLSVGESVHVFLNRPDISLIEH